LAKRIQSALGDSETAVMLGGVPGTEAPDKVGIVILLSSAAVGRGLSAAELIRGAAPEIDGRGGGSDEMAQAGGRDSAGLGKAFDTARRAIARELE
jgi:alanyl-tRNA synthetase